MSDPFARHLSSDDLTSTTPITTVTETAMAHAGQTAAALVGGRAGGKSSKTARKAAAAALAAAAVKPFSDERPEAGIEPLALETAVTAEPDSKTEAVLETNETQAAANREVVEALPDDDAELAAAMADTVIDMSRAAAEASIEAVETIEAPVEDRVPPVDLSDTQMDSVVAFRGKFAEAFQSNVEASLTYWMSLMRVASPAEAIEIHNQHLRRQMEAFVTQSRELTTLAQQAAMTTMRSLG